MAKRMFVECDFGDGNKHRVMVRWFRGHPGMVVRGVVTCTGCTEYVEGYLAYGPLGCSECGYTGKRVTCDWCPLPREAAKQARRKRKLARAERNSHA